MVGGLVEILLLLIPVLPTIVGSIVLAIHVIIGLLNKVVWVCVTHLLDELLAIALPSVVLVELSVEMVIHFSFSDLFFSLASFHLALSKLFCLSLAYSLPFNLLLPLLFHPSFGFLISCTNFVLHSFLLFFFPPFCLFFFSPFFSCSLFSLSSNFLKFFLLFSFLFLFFPKLFFLHFFVFFKSLQLFSILLYPSVLLLLF